MKHRLYAFVSVLGIAATLSLAQVQSIAPAGPRLDPTPTRTENFGALFTSGGWRFPLWRGGSLIRTRPHSQGVVAVQVFDDAGALRREFRLSVPGTSDASVVGATAMKDGRFVVGVRASDSDDREANLLGVTDDSGNIKLLFRTNPFVIDQLCTGDNGTVWAYGWEERSRTDPVLAYKALRQYDLQKGEIQAVLDRGSMKSSAVIGGDVVLHCAAGQVFLFDGYSGQLFAYETAMRAMSTWAAGSLQSENIVTSGFVITDSGEVFASIYQRLYGSGEARVFWLKRNGSLAHWMPVGLLPRTTRIFASSEDQLIVLRSDGFAEFRHMRP